MASDRKTWVKGSHEARVESFYGWGAENYGDFHKGYLNFGLWEEGVRTYEEAAENMVYQMAQLAGVNQKSHLLDVGCGMGTQDIYIAEKFKVKQVDALDVTWKHIEIARQRAQTNKCSDQVHFHHESGIKLPFPDKHFTNVISIEAAEHFNTRQTFLEEAYRVLKPGGGISIGDFTLKQEPKTFMEKLVVESARALWKVPDDNVYSIEVYKERLKLAGFENVEAREVGASTIPGYYYEQSRPEVKKAVGKIRGFVAGRLGFIIDIAVFQAFQKGLLEYVLVSARKPN